MSNESESKPKVRRHQIGEGAWILDTSGTAAVGEAMKLQADRSSELVNRLFASGALRITGSYRSNGLFLVPVDRENNESQDV